MSTKPNKVELFVKEQLKMTLTDSHGNSLNGVIQGKVDRVKIFGKKNTVVTFFDDQQFRTGENWVTIKKTTDAPIEVEVSKNFVSSEDEKGERLYTGNGPGFEFAFSRKEKKNYLEKLEDTIKSTIGFDYDDILKFARAVGVPHTDKIDLVKAYLTGSGNNYRVDNMSSVRFGK